jgi:hypothetical protein
MPSWRTAICKREPRPAAAESGPRYEPFVRSRRRFQGEIGPERPNAVPIPYRPLDLERGTPRSYSPTTRAGKPRRADYVPEPRRNDSTADPSPRRHGAVPPRRASPAVSDRPPKAFGNDIVTRRNDWSASTRTANRPRARMESPQPEPRDDRARPGVSRPRPASGRRTHRLLIGAWRALARGCQAAADRASSRRSSSRRCVA